MDHTTLGALLTLAAAIGVGHTLAGPDHYVPFIAMARVGCWSMPRTALITALCGVGHVLGSIVLGLLGAGFGWAVGGLEAFEGRRGDVAGWLLLGFGLAYLVWGVWRAIRNRPHAHLHVHEDGTLHTHEHGHHGAHAHVHTAGAGPRAMTPWILFTIFVFGPCEPLIPMLMYPAARHSWWGLALVTVAFALATIGTMLVVVLAGYFGTSRLRLPSLERYSHVAAGVALTACGLAVKLGL